MCKVWKKSTSDVKKKKASDIEKNPFKIIWRSRKELLPISVWLILIVLNIIIFIVTMFVPDYIIKVNFSKINLNQLITFSFSAIGFVIAMYTFGKEIYTEEDLARFYIREKDVYYSFLADYLFAALNWLVMLLATLIILFVDVSFSTCVKNFCWVIYISFFALSIVTTVSIVIKNINRTTNKVLLEVVKIENGD